MESSSRKSQFCEALEAVHRQVVCDAYVPISDVINLACAARPLVHEDAVMPGYVADMMRRIVSSGEELRHGLTFRECAEIIILAFEALEEDLLEAQTPGGKATRH